MTNTIDLEEWKKRQKQTSAQEFKAKLEAAKKLPKAEYERRRKELASEIGVRTSFLDEECRGEHDEEPGTRPAHWQVEPSGEPCRASRPHYKDRQAYQAACGSRQRGRYGRIAVGCLHLGSRGRRPFSDSHQ